MHIPASAPTGPARRLVRLFRALNSDDQGTLIAFAEFLAGRTRDQGRDEHAASDPEPIPRPAEETVIGAMKRLSRSYFMLDRTALLNEAASLMAGHVLNGRDAQAVIDELEVLFARHYAQYRDGR
jgi:hypothetical protein